MAVPKRRTSKRVTRKGRTHKKLPIFNLINCSNCQELILPHHICPKCGHYHGEQLLEVAE